MCLYVTIYLHSSRTTAKLVVPPYFVRRYCSRSDILCQRYRNISDATHIFDGLHQFPTHIAHMRFGAFVTEPTRWPLQAAASDATNSSSLYSIALQWLTEDREYRKDLEKQGKKTRGARRDEVCEIASLSFFCYLMKNFSRFLLTLTRSTISKKSSI